MASANQLAIKQGRDPLADKYQAAAELKRSKMATFSEATRQLIDLNRPTWSNAKHAAQWESTLATYAYPVLGLEIWPETGFSRVVSYTWGIKK